MKKTAFKLLTFLVTLMLALTVGCADKKDENKRDVAIFMYHNYISAGTPGDFDITAERFEEHVKALTEAGYSCVSFSDLVSFVNGEGDLPEKCVVLSTDDGYKSVIDIALPICENYGAELTCAVIGGKIHQHDHFVPDESMAGRIELTSHTYSLHAIHADGYKGVNVPMTGRRLVVEVARRFVCYDDCRVVEKRSCYGDALLLSSRELVRHLMCLAFHSHCLEDVGDASGHFIFRFPSCGPEYEEEIFFHGAVHQKLEILKDHSHLSSQIRYVLVPDAVEFVTADPSFSICEGVLCDHRLDDGCLSRTYFSDNVNKVSGVDIKVQSVYHGGLSVHNIRLAE